MMKPAPLIRTAVPNDAELVTKHRHEMFSANDFATNEVLLRMDAAFCPWVRKQLQEGRYFGLLAEDAQGVVAGAGIFFCEFPPHWRHAESVRAYVMNVYTEPAYRGLGLAKLLTTRLLEESRRRGVNTVVLHASPQGRPVYKNLGFARSDEMILGLSTPAADF